MRPFGFLVGSSIGLFAILFSTIVFAQADQAQTRSVIRIEAGNILEIGTDTVSAKPDFSWILTKERKFQNAQRSRFFKTRFAQTGVYSLDISVQESESSQNEYNAFEIIVTDPIGGDPPIASGGPLKAILKTSPTTINGTVYLPPEGGILSLDGSASTSKIVQYALDLDSGVDTDSDGDPTNDFENLGTYSSETGSPLLYFVTEKGRERNITLTVTDTITGKTDATSVRVIFGIAPADTGIPQTNDASSPISVQLSDATATFSVRLPEAQTLGKELLYEWNFGDGSRSLLTSPVHTFANAGGYAVSLIVRDITNGQIVYQGSNGLQIETTGIQSSASSSSQASEQIKPAESSDSGSGIWSLLRVGLIVILLLSFAIGLYALFMWIKRKTAGKLVETFESMEKTIVKGEKASEAKPEPLKIKKESTVSEKQSQTPESISEREKSKTEFSGTSRNNTVPLSTSGPVPSWLQKTTAPVPAAAPMAASSSTPTVGAKASHIAAPEKAPEVPKNTSAPVPDWLKQAPQKKEVNTNLPTPTPKPPETKTEPAIKPPVSLPPSPIQTPETTKPSAPMPQSAPTSAPKPAPALPKPEMSSTQNPVITVPAVIKEIPKPEKVSAPAPSASTPKGVEEKPKEKLILSPVKTETNQAAEKPKQVAEPEKKPVAPQAPAKPVPQNIEKQEKPAAKLSPKPKTNGENEAPIAIIKADSLTQE